MNSPLAHFYVTGGNLRGDASCYVPRQADRDLYEGLKNGEFCYVLTSRQMGKSSLMVRTAQRLRQENVDVVLLDLTAIGQNVTVEQWYDGLLQHLGQQLGLEDELDQYWQEHARLPPLQRWMRALREVVLPHRRQLVIFVDEIDAVHSLPFSTDEFFAGIREIYNRRADEGELNRLTFCLLGVATPSDLISDARTTPFNIGRRIELLDFTETEAAPLAQGLGRDGPLAAKLLKRVLYWTGGHPYLTQRLCLAVAEDATVVRPSGVDRVCEGLFLSHGAREKDNNLLFVRERILRSPVDRAGLLDLYQQVRRQRRVRDDEKNPLAGVLRLSGIIRVVEGYLWVRNRIYYRVFDREWVQANMPDAEKRRQRRAFRRGVLRASGVAAALFAAAAACGFWYWDSHIRDHAAYFNTIVKRFGVFEGVGPLTTADVAARSLSFKVVTEGRHGPVVRVEAVNSRDELNPDNNVGTYLRRARDDTTPMPLRACRWEFERDNHGDLIHEKALNKLRRQVWAFVYAVPVRTPKEKPTRSDPPPPPVHGHFIGPNGYPQPQADSTAEYVEITFTGDGLEATRTYYDRHGDKRPGPDKAYGVAQEFDARGLVLKEQSLDAQGKPTIDDSGNSGMVYQRDPILGNITEARSIDTQGRSKELKSGYTRYKASFDEHGNLSEQAFFDDAGKRVQVSAGYSKVKYTYDSHGNLTEEEYFDPNDRPRHRDGYAKLRLQYNKRDQLVELAYLDETGKLAADSNGRARAIREYDQDGNLTEEAYFDSAGKPVLHPEKYAKYAGRFDDRGYEVERIFLDAEGKPVRHRDGYMKWSRRYDERGALVEETFSGYDASECKYARRRKKYDERGKVVEETNFNEQGELTPDANGHARWTTGYDDDGHLTDRAYFDKDGNPARYDTGYTRWHKRYEGDKLVETTYAGYDARIEGFSQRREKYDDQGKVKEVINLDSLGQFANDKSGLARWVTEFYEDGRDKTRAYFDKDGRPARIQDGYLTGHTSWYKKYAGDGRLVEQDFLGYDPYKVYATTQAPAIKPSTTDLPGSETADVPDTSSTSPRKSNEKEQEAHSSEGFTTRVAKINDKGQVYEDTFLNADGTPATDEYGNFRVVRDYDDSGNPIRDIYFADGRNGFRKMVAKLNAQGFGTEFVFFNEKGEPTRHKSGHMKWTRRYDASGRKVVEETYWGYDGKNGYAKMVVKLNEQGRPVENTYFDAKDQPTHHIEGNTTFLRRYDARGQIIEAIYTGYDSAVFKFSEQRHRYNQDGKVVEIANFDAKGQPVHDKDGHARWTTGYDNQGHAVDRMYFNKDNIPAPYDDGHTGWHREYQGGKLIDQIFYGYDASKGFAKRIARYNERGFIVEDTYYDANNRPTRTSNGYSKRVRKYNNQDIVIEAILSGFDAKKAGYSQQRVKYDTRGNVIEVANFDDQGKRAHDKDGHAFWTSKYDDDDHLIEQAYYDKDGNPAPYEDGYTRTERRYEGSKLVERIFAGYNQAKFGFAKVVVSIDSQGRQMERTFFDSDGKPVLHKGGYARKLNLYDDSGSLIDALFYDFQGHLLTVRPLVMKVIPGGQEEKLGLKEGDVLLKYAGTPVPSSTKFNARRKKDSAGPPRELVVRRGDQSLTFLVQPGPLDAVLDDQVVRDDDAARLKSAKQASSSK